MKSDVLMRFDYDRPARLMSRPEAAAAIRNARAAARHPTGTRVRYDASAHATVIDGPAASCTLQHAPSMH
jgi:hypothetical protein